MTSSIWQSLQRVRSRQLEFGLGIDGNDAAHTQARLSPVGIRQTLDRRTEGWGSATQVHGVYTCEYGLILCGAMLIALTGNVSFGEMLEGCLARVAPNENIDNCHKWCNTGFAHMDTHTPLGEPSDFIVIHLYKPGTLAHPDYLEFANPKNWEHLGGPDKRAFHRSAFDKRTAEAANPNDAATGPGKAAGPPGGGAAGRQAVAASTFRARQGRARKEEPKAKAVEAEASTVDEGVLMRP